MYMYVFIYIYIYIYMICRAAVIIVCRKLVTSMHNLCRTYKEFDKS